MQDAVAGDVGQAAHTRHRRQQPHEGVALDQQACQEEVDRQQHLFGQSNNKVSAFPDGHSHKEG